MANDIRAVLERCIKCCERSVSDNGIYSVPIYWRMLGFVRLYYVFVGFETRSIFVVSCVYLFGFVCISELF